MRRQRYSRKPRPKSKRNDRTSYYKAGDWDVVSDISGRVFKRSEMRYTWDNKLCHTSEWYPRHPQLTINTPTDSIAVPDARPENIKFKDGGTQAADGSKLPWPRP